MNTFFRPFFKPEQRVELTAIFIFILGHLIAAYTSFGFHHPDEHFQILEFAHYWVGFSKDTSLLPWEFTAQIRPWFQPMIHGVLMKASDLLGIYNPFSMAYFFRFLYALFNILALWQLWLAMKKRYDLNPKWLLFISMLWFLPYIHVRTSSENLSGIFLTFAFAYYLNHQKYFWTGILFGFAFLARYQIGLGLAGFGLCLLIRDRSLKQNHLKLFLGFLLPVFLGIILDRLGYGNWTFTAYRYFKVNLVDGIAATYNPYPWYQYFIWITELNPLISLPLLAGAFIYLKKSKIDELASFVFCFFFLHFFIINKEYRFLFPILNLAIFMSAVGLQSLDQYLPLNKKFLLPYGAINLAGFCVSSLHGASVQTLWPVHMADRYSKPGETWLTNRNYFDQFSQGYYQLKNHQVLVFHSGDALEGLLQAHPQIKVLIDGRFKDPITQGMISVVQEHHCEILTASQPEFIFKHFQNLDVMNRITYQAVYSCDLQHSN